MKTIKYTLLLALIFSFACKKDNPIDTDNDRRIVPIIDNGLIGFWPLDGNADDYSGNQHDGIIKGDIFIPKRNEDGSCFANFNSISTSDINRIDVENHPDLHIQNNFTLSCWIRVNKKRGVSPVLDYEFLSKWGPSGKGFASYVLGVNGDNKFYLGTYRNKNTTVYTDNKISLEEWHHVAATFDDGLGTLYVDGEYAGSLSNMDTPQVSITDLSFGARPDNLSTFSGQMDDIYIFERTLSEDEIKVLYQN